MPSGSRANAEQVSAIVAIAARLFAERGYRGTSMRDIGKAVGLHAGSLYVHIEGKEDLLQAIVSTIMEQSERDMADVLARGGSPAEQLREIARRDLRLIGGNREFATVFFHDWRNLSPVRQQEVIASRDRWENGLRDVIARGIAEGDFRPVDVRVAGIALASMLNWAYVWYSPDGGMSVDELADQFAGMLIDGLAVRPVPVGTVPAAAQIRT